MSDALLKQAEAHLERGDRLAARGLIAQQIVTNPGDVHALHLLSSIDMEEGHFDLAREKIEKVLALDPSHAPAAYNLGVCLMNEGDNTRALETFRQTIQINPGHSGALYNVAYLLRLSGHLGEASAHFEKLVKQNPGWVSAWEAFCETLIAENRLEDALSACDELVRQSKANARIYRLRADAFRRLGRLAEAESSYLSSFKIDSADPDTLHNLAGTLQLLDRANEAIPVYERVLVIAGSDSRFTSRFDPALGELILACRSQCQWQRLEVYEAQAMLRVNDEKGAITPFVTALLTDNPKTLQASAQRTWSGEMRAPTANPVPNRSRLKIGYILDNFGEHPATYQLAELIEGRDKTRFEFVAYNTGDIALSDTSLRVKKTFDAFRSMRRSSDEQIAGIIASDQLDLLINGMGYGRHARLNALRSKPVPLIANYLAFPGTLGTKLFDYIIADGTVIKAGEETYFDESIIRLPDAYRTVCANRRLAQPSKTRADYGLQHDAFVYCAFGSTTAISQKRFDALMGILKDAPNSQLWLSEDKFSVRANLRKEATARGISGERLVFAAMVSGEEHTQRQLHADLFLDTWPLGGESEVHDALSVGLPVLTRMGDSFASRVGAGLVGAAGLPELIASDDNAFHRLAVRLANEPAELTALRARLQDSRTNSAVFSTQRLRLHLEHAFEYMIERHRSGKEPESYSVPRLV